MGVSTHSGVEAAHQRLIGGYQLLQTLVAIRLRSVSDPEGVRHLTWLSDIVAALGLLARRGGGGGPIDFNAYLADAAAFWRRACEGRSINLAVRGHVDALPDSHALPLAIILHELMSNAVRHAFPDGQHGSVAIAFSSASGGVSLVVRDTGVGAEALIPNDGLAMVEGLVAHLGGAISIETAPNAGVGVRIRLPVETARTH